VCVCVCVCVLCQLQVSRIEVNQVVAS